MLDKEILKLELVISLPSNHLASPDLASIYLASPLLRSRFLSATYEIQHHAQDRNPSPDKPSVRFSPLVDPLEKDEVHIEEMKPNRQDTDDRNVNAKCTHS